MNGRRVVFAATLSLAMAAGAWAQTITETTTRVVDGEVVRMEPGKAIVVRSGGVETTYVLAPGLAVPAGLQAGRRVSLQIEPLADGSTLVREVTTLQQPPVAETTTTISTGPVTGQVIRLEPGKTIVLRSNGKETTYSLAPDVALPAAVQVGQTATVTVEPGPGGSAVVKRVKTTTLTPEGQVKETTEITRTEASGQVSTSTMSTISGRVESYLPGKSITVLDSKGSRLAYVLGAGSLAPAEIVGKEVTVYAPTNDQGGTTTYEIERDGDTIKIKAKSKPQN